MTRAKTSRRIARGFSLAILLLAGGVSSLAQENGTRRVAAVVTEYRHNSHADVILSRLLLTDMLDGTGRDFPLKLVVALHRSEARQRHQPPARRLASLPDQDPDRRRPDAGDGPPGRRWRLPGRGARQLPVLRHGESSVSQAPVLGRDDRGVPQEREGRAGLHRQAPVRQLERRQADLRHRPGAEDPADGGLLRAGDVEAPPRGRRAGARLTEIVGITYGSTDAYGFHGLEAVQSLAEQRRGGETGVRAVQCLCGDAVWRALDERTIDPELFRAALARAPRFENGRVLDRKAVPKPKLLIVHLQRRPASQPLRAEPRGGRLDGGVAGRRGTSRSSPRNSGRRRLAPPPTSRLLLEGIQRMFFTGTPSWPVERTLLTSGTLDALLLSLTRGGALHRDARAPGRVPADLAVEGTAGTAAGPALVGAVNRIRSTPRHASALTRSDPGQADRLPWGLGSVTMSTSTDSCR